MIAFAGCLRGIQCGRSAEAVGRAATSAVSPPSCDHHRGIDHDIVYYQLDI